MTPPHRQRSSTSDERRPSFARPARAGVWVVLLLCCTAGCTGFVYNRLDSMAGWYLENLVSLDAAQSNALRAWLTETLQWHRESELVKYSQFLRELAAHAARPADRALYARIETTFEQYWSQLIDKTAPQATHWLLALSPEQVAELDRNLTQRSQERAKDDIERLAAGEWHAERARDLQKQLKRWTGSVSGPQRQLIVAAAGGFEPTHEDWLQSQQQWRAALRAALLDDAAREDKERLILQLLHEPNRQWTAAYRTKNERNREHAFAVLAKLDATLSPVQRRHLQQELTALAEKLDDLTEKKS